jgi:hypothetical protein
MAIDLYGDTEKSSSNGSPSISSQGMMDKINQKISSIPSYQQKMAKQSTTLDKNPLTCQSLDNRLTTAESMIPLNSQKNALRRQVDKDSSTRKASHNNPALSSLSAFRFQKKLQKQALKEQQEGVRGGV